MSIIPFVGGFALGSPSKVEFSSAHLQFEKPRIQKENQMIQISENLEL